MAGGNINSQWRERARERYLEQGMPKGLRDEQ